MTFITLKLSGKDLGKIKLSNPKDTDSDTIDLIEMLKNPYGYFFNYHAEWSLSRLEEICEAENLPIPGEEDS